MTSSFTAEDTLSQLNAWRPVVERSLDEVAGAVKGMGTALAQLTSRLDTTQNKVEAKLTEAEAALQRVVADAREAFQGREASLQSAMEEAKGRFLGIDRQLADLEAKVLASQTSGLQDLERRLSTALASQTSGLQELERRLAANVAAATAVPQQDPWAAAAAGPAAPVAPAAATGSSGSPGSAYRVNNRDWGDNKRLDLVTQPEGYMTWRDRALGHLCKDRPDVLKLLLWAEKEDAEITQSGFRTAAAQLRLQEGAEGADHVVYVLFGAMKYLLADTLLSRSRTCEGNGLELWRTLYLEWQGCAPQVRHAKARNFQDPDRCTSVGQLWEALPRWLQLGADLEAAALHVPEWMKSTALEKLVPKELLEAIVGRPTELNSYEKRLAFVKAQMGHARGVSQAKQLASSHGRKEKDGDVHMGALSAEASEEPTAPSPSSGQDALIWHLQAEVEKHQQSGDWAGLGAAALALQAISKGKGKGKGGFPGKGWGKGPWGGDGFGAAGGKGPQSWQQTPWNGGGGGGKSGGGGKGDFFDGLCNHCGKYGHRKMQCRQLDQEMGAVRAAKGKGKGKGLYYTGGEEAAAEYGGSSSAAPPAEGSGGAAGGQNDGHEVQWWMGGLNSIVREPAAPWGRPSYFAALQDSADDEDEEKEFPMLGATMPKPAHVAVPAPPEPRGERTARNQRWRRQASQQAQEEAGSGWHVRIVPPRCSLDCCGTQGRPEASEAGALSLLTREAMGTGDSNEKFVGALGTDPRGRMIEAVIDSGAEESVAPPGVFPGPVTPSAMSRAGLKYKAANGSRIPNLGQQKVLFRPSEGHTCGMPFQVAEVERPLIAVSQLAAAGNEVTLDKNDGVIRCKGTGRTIKLERKGGVYILRMWVASSGASDFTRPGK